MLSLYVEYVNTYAKNFAKIYRNVIIAIENLEGSNFLNGKKYGGNSRSQ